MFPIGSGGVDLSDNSKFSNITDGFRFATVSGTLLAHLFVELASSPQASFDPHFSGPP
jgi:hypothetical protein